MLTPLQSVYLEGHAGEPLPDVFQSLAEAGTHFLRGQLCLVVAGGGAGKSALILAYAAKANISTLYFSPDSDRFTQTARLLSIKLGWEQDRATEIIRSKQLPPEAVAALGQSKIRFDFRSSPGFKDLDNAINSYDEVYGDPPALIVVDNITNLRSGTADNDEDPYSGQEVILEFLHETARETGACVVGLHHATGPYNDNDKPIPQSGIKGQISRLPALILTLHRAPSYSGETLNVSTVKNRFGSTDSTGNTFVALDFDAARMHIADRK